MLICQSTTVSFGPECFHLRPSIMDLVAGDPRIVSLLLFIIIGLVKPDLTATDKHLMVAIYGVLRARVII